MTTALAIAAIVISIVSAGLAWWGPSIEAHRHHAERTPKLYGQLRAFNDGTLAKLSLELETPEPLDDLRVLLPQGEPQMMFTASQHGAYAQDESRTAWLYEGEKPLKPGDRATWQVRLNGASNGTARVWVECSRTVQRKVRGVKIWRARVERWPVLVVVDLPKAGTVHLGAEGTLTARGMPVH